MIQSSYLEEADDVSEPPPALRLRVDELDEFLERLIHSSDSLFQRMLQCAIIFHRYFLEFYALIIISIRPHQRLTLQPLHLRTPSLRHLYESLGAVAVDWGSMKEQLFPKILL